MFPFELRCSAANILKTFMRSLQAAAIVLLAALALQSVSAVAKTAPPNLLLIIADDCTYRDLEVYGGQAKTPNLNRLADEGMKFTRCFQAAPMCSPTRHCLYTGLYPVKSGAYPNHTMAYPWVKSVAHYFNDGGFRSYLSGKSHVNPKSVFPFEYSAIQVPPNGGEGNPDPAAFADALKKSEETKTPFLFIAASHEPHTPWNRGDSSKYPPETLKLPPVLVDTPATRQGFSRYLAEVTYFDGQVGEILALLDKSTLRESTLVMVLSEQGNSLPFAKWTCYDAGLQSGCIVRWPGHVKPGSTSDALIEYVDVVPTFLEVAGLTRPEILDGQSFLPVLTGATNHHKDFVFGLQTTRGIYSGSDYFGIRTVRNERYRYIRNLTPDATFQNTEVKTRIFKSWERKAEAGDENARKLVYEYQHRPAEELYDCASDPWNRTNLILDEKLSSIRKTLSAQLDAWMKQQGDEGQATEMKAFERMPSHNRANAAKD